MGSGTHINIAHGMPNSQLTLYQLTNQIVSTHNVALNNIEKKIDFFVGPNKKTLPAVFKQWIGKNQREVLLKKVSNPKLKNVVDQLYRKGSFIGDGGTAAAIKFEKATGIGLSKNGRFHTQKGIEMIKHIEQKILTDSTLSKKERMLAKKLANDLKLALGGIINDI